MDGSAARRLGRVRVRLLWGRLTSRSTFQPFWSILLQFSVYNVLNVSKGNNPRIPVPSLAPPKGISFRKDLRFSNLQVERQIIPAYVVFNQFMEPIDILVVMCFFFLIHKIIFNYLLSHLVRDVFK